MTPPELHLQIHLHLHEDAAEYRARRTRRLTDRPAYLRASHEADLAHYADLMRMTARADDPHLRAAMLKIADRVGLEIADVVDARRTIAASIAPAVERVAARRIRQARSNAEAPHLKVGGAKANEQHEIWAACPHSSHAASPHPRR
jgi:hypothetical protein